MKIVYELSYFNLIPVNTTNTISTVASLKKELEDVKNFAIMKLYQFKMASKICKEPEKNQDVIKNIFDLNVIKLEDIYLKIIKDKENKYYVQFYDDNVEDATFEVNLKKEDFKIRTNKKIKIFS